MSRASAERIAAGDQIILTGDLGRHGIAVMAQRLGLTFEPPVQSDCAALSAPLTEAEMAALAGIDRGSRLIKGHVFLWKAGQTWEDLWDLNGEITPA